MCIAARAWLHMLPDQERARLLFGRFFAAIIALMWAALVPWLRAHPPELNSAGRVIAAAHMLAMMPVYCHLSALMAAHRLTCLASSLLAIAVLPAWSELGRPAETLIMGGGLILGEAIGYLLEWQERVDYLRRLQANRRGRRWRKK